MANAIRTCTVIETYLVKRRKNSNDKYSATSPHVYYENGIWHMWYSSGTNWLKINDKLEHTYDIKYACSKDGVNWSRSNETVLRQKTKYEAITKPSMIKLNRTYHMWYCYRGSKNFRDGLDSYRIGYATSDDLRHWTRRDENAGIDVSETGWDSKMIAYPAVIQINREIIMLYNGNDFGADGFGYAILNRGDQYA